MEARTLFDIASKPFAWSVLIVPIGLFLIGMLLAWSERMQIGKYPVRKVGYISCGVGAVVAAYICVAWLVQRHEGVTALQTGQYSTVEGPVQGFRPMPYEGHQDEVFTVDRHIFSYTDFAFTPCFNRSSSHGGPIRAGLNLRIAYVDDCILRIDLVPNSPDQSTKGASTTAPPRSN